MTTFMDVLLVLGMFLLRIGVPLLITLALGYALSLSLIHISEPTRPY